MRIGRKSEQEVDECVPLQEQLLKGRNLIIISNRGPVTYQYEDGGAFSVERGGGGLVTGLLGLARRVQGTWIASAMTEADRAWGEGEVSLGDEGSIRLSFVSPRPEAYNGYYNVISNPLLWFLQHSMWDFSHAPTITRETWQAWEEGYIAVNRQFAEAAVRQIQANQGISLVMLQDYQLYLVPLFIRQIMSRNRAFRKRYILEHFVHIPWPGTEDWGLLPPVMRVSILEGLCATDLLGFQTRMDSLNFIRCCETLLPDARVNYRNGRITYRNHITYVRDFPISIDVGGLHKQAASVEVQQYRQAFEEGLNGMRLIVRIDRSEPSKNIVRGFQAFEDLLESHPEHRKAVQFLTLLVPSRLEVEEYQSYLDELMAAAGRVNARYGTSDWEPVRVLVGENYPRALAALQLYDVLLVNPVADGMNLVAKEGPTLNDKGGVIVLSERAGASQQLGEDALIISPCDVYATAEALHQALTMREGERFRRANNLRESVERDDIGAWLCQQLDTINQLNLAK